MGDRRFDFGLSLRSEYGFANRNYPLWSNEHLKTVIHVNNSNPASARSAERCRLISCALASPRPDAPFADLTAPKAPRCATMAGTAVACEFTNQKFNGRLNCILSSNNHGP
jgi:hypothetical protein